MPPIPPRPIALVANRARRALHALADAPLPPEVKLFEAINGLNRTHVIATFAELELADHLDDGRNHSAEDLAQRTNSHPAALLRLLYGAATIGLVTMNRRGAVKVTAMGRRLAKDHPQSMRDWALYTARPSTRAAWGGLTESVRTNQGAFDRVHGKTVWEHFAEHPDEEHEFAGAMRQLTNLSADFTANGYDWPQGATIADVAGGIGTLVAAIARRRPDLKGIVVDSAGVLPEAEAFLQQQGLAARVRPTVGNIFEQIDAEADVYLLKDVLHDWDDADCAQIIATITRAMPSGAKLLLIEIIQEPNRPNFDIPMTDLTMLTQCTGRQRSVDELQALLTQAGLRPGTVTRTLVHGLIEGVKA